VFSLGQMAKLLHCCERHVSRLFRKEWGTGFLSYVSDLRLQKACQLLRQGNQKIIDVALESGHGSLAHFNYVFKKRFWRDADGVEGAGRSRRRAGRRGRRRCKCGDAGWLLCGAAGILGSGRAEAAEAAGTNAVPAAAPLTFQVDRYEVRGNTLLPTNVIRAPWRRTPGRRWTRTPSPKPRPLCSWSITSAATADGEGDIAAAKSDEQHLLLEVIEGKLTAIRILHNRHFSSNNIMASLPYLKTLESGQRTLNENVFNGELARANSNPDRQISPEIRPGLEPGTSALILDVKDRLPLHGRLDWDTTVRRARRSSG